MEDIISLMVWGDDDDSFDFRINALLIMVSVDRKDCPIAKVLSKFWVDQFEDGVFLLLYHIWSATHVTWPKK